MIRSLRTAFVAVSACIVLILAGCGYQFSGTGPGPKPGLDRLAIPMFENLTGQPGLESYFTTALRREFNARSRMKVVPKSEAQMILQGRITRLTALDVAHRTADETIESRLTVTLDVRCTSVADGSILWQDSSLSYFQEYLQNDASNTSSEDRRRALEYVAREVAMRIHDRFLSGF